VPVLTLSPPNALIGHDLRSPSSNCFPGSPAFTEPIGGPNMGNSVHAEPVIRFQDFQVNLETGELWKAGIRLKLQDQPFKVLVTLLQRPGQVVTREELQQLIWPQESFGDFDHAINLAINKLRSTLGDSAEVPHLIETLPRRGYRFIAPVESNSTPKRDASPATKGRFDRITGRWSGVGVGVAVLVLMSAIAMWWLVRKPAESPVSSVEAVPLVALQRKQETPAFSPDGNQVAFAVYEGPHAGIYTTLIGGEKSLQLTDNPGDCCPTWSPDGRQIAFVRLGSDKERSFYVIPALGGSEHKLYTGPLNRIWSCDRLDWSPDGKVLAFSEPNETRVSSRITLLSLADLTTRQLTSPGDQQFDCDPAFSPYGSSIAFGRGLLGGALGDLFVVPISGGEPRRLTAGNSGGSPAWTQDGKEIVFTSAMGGLRSLWRIPASGGTPQPVAGVGEIAINPSISRKGNQLVYQRTISTNDIWRLDLKDARHAFGSPTRVLSARGLNLRPSFSPDGKKIVFESDRLGYSDIWYCESDGSNCVQLTSLHGISGTARWSPDGHYISFESISQDYYEIYVIEVPSGRPHLVSTFPGVDNGTPNWSRDGKTIYFSSAHGSGTFQIWKVAFKGGSPVRVTRNGGVYAIESDDGRFLYYGKHDQPGVWKMPLDGGEETRVLDQPRGWCNWQLVSTGIYFLNENFKPNGRIGFFDFATRETTPIFSLEKPRTLFGGLAVSPDGRSLLYAQTELDDSYIMLVKNFR
jgi:Tol biopolymer transport system component/DNA-binding winged helix-turn-helix (wHTH) protein